MVNYLLAGIIILFLIVVFWGTLKKALSKASMIALNSIAGILILLFLRTLVGWDIPINLATLVVCGLFGIPGVGALVVLHLGGML
jgi:pro-sigmaK processing inhibitor BofA